MAHVSHLQKKFLDYIAYLFNDEVVNEQFADVQNSKEINQSFPITMIKTYFKTSPELIDSIAKELRRPVVNFEEVYKLAQTLKGSSTTAGFSKIKNISAKFEKLCEDKNVVMLRRYTEQLHYENSILRNKIETLLRLEKGILDAKELVPTIQLKPVVCIPENSN